MLLVDGSPARTAREGVAGRPGGNGLAQQRRRNPEAAIRCRTKVVPLEDGAARLATDLQYPTRPVSRPGTAGAAIASVQRDMSRVTLAAYPFESDSAAFTMPRITHRLPVLRRPSLARAAVTALLASLTGKKRARGWWWNRSCGTAARAIRRGRNRMAGTAQEVRWGMAEATGKVTGGSQHEWSS